MKIELPGHEVVEVVLRKEMTMKHYRKIYTESKKKGWSIQAYELNRYKESTNHLSTTNYETSDKNTGADDREDQCGNE